MKNASRSECEKITVKQAISVYAAKSPKLATFQNLSTESPSIRDLPSEEKTADKHIKLKNELLKKKLTDRTVPKQFGGGRKRETLKRFSSFFREWSPFTSVKCWLQREVWNGSVLYSWPWEGCTESYPYLLMVPTTFQSAHLLFPLEESLKRQKQSLVQWLTLDLDRIGLPILMFKLFSHLQLIFRIQLELSTWFSDIMHGKMPYRF